MLYLVKGRAGSGKTAEIRNRIKILAENGSSVPVLLVPEQFTFETERALLKLVGARILKNIHFYSFPRMAYRYLQNNGVVNMKIAGAGVKTVLMAEALSHLQGNLKVFSNIRQNAVAISPLVEFSKELKYCCIDSALIDEKAPLVENSFLKDKLYELGLINDAFNALLEQSYFDDDDALTRFTRLAAEKGYFKGKTLFLDSFRVFTKQELECISVALQQTDNVYVSLCADSKREKNSPFSHMDALEIELRALANEQGVSVDEIFCAQSDNAYSQDIFHIESNIYSSKILEKKKSDGNVSVVRCSDLYDECRYVAATIKKLLRSGGYRCRDIAVIERTNGTYKKQIIDALQRAGIPVFNDSRKPLATQTLFVHIGAALECVTKGFTTELIMRYLKTGLTGMSCEDIATLEKYALIWGVTGKNWTNDFTMHPDGFGEEFTESSNKKLEKINKLRVKAVAPLLKLKKQCDEDGTQIAKFVYEFLSDTHVPSNLYDEAVLLEESGFPADAANKETSWNMFIDILDTMAELTGDRSYTLTRWLELYSMLVASGDMGEIPQGLDEVIVGCADRIRTEKIKVVFLVGVNKDEFPLVKVNNGVLTDSDRIILKNIGLKVRAPFEDTLNEERFITYCAVTAATDKLYITYKCCDSSGGVVYPSELVKFVDCAFENTVHISSSDLPNDYYLESYDDVFSALSKSYSYDKSLYYTLRELLSQNEDYQGRLAAFDALASNKPLTFNDKSVATALFGEDLYLSASRVEDFYKCPFAYFVRHGLRAMPLRLAQVDSAQSGIIVHHIMEAVLKKYSKSAFVNAQTEELENYVREIIREYLTEKMGGFEEKSKRFMFLFNRFAEIAMSIIHRLQAEFRVGDFEPCEFELKIGGEKVSAYELPLTEGTIKLTGYIDRVDKFEGSDNNLYLRVVDYKTGEKNFKLSELLDGLNLQMVIYLMALEKCGKSYFGDFIPAGVLYLPSKIGISNYLSSRHPSAESVSAQKRVSGKLSGMVLDSPVVFNGMGVDKFEDFFPVKFKKDGSASGSYFGLKHFKALSKRIDSTIIDMGESLHSGNIPALPYGKDGEGNMCKYCAYISVCGREQKGDVTEPIGLSHNETLELLEGEADE